MSLTAMLFSFDGRLRRRDFWMMSLLLFGAAVVIYGLLWVMLIMPAVEQGQAISQQQIAAGEKPNGGGAVVGAALLALLIGWIVLLWPNVAVCLKRWHDRDKGWPWLFLGLVPYVGPIWALVETGFLDGTRGPNRFGPSPKDGESWAGRLEMPERPIDADDRRPPSVLDDILGPPPQRSGGQVAPQIVQPARPQAPQGFGRRTAPPPIVR